MDSMDTLDGRFEGEGTGRTTTGSIPKMRRVCRATPAETEQNWVCNAENFSTPLLLHAKPPAQKTTLLTNCRSSHC